MSTHSTAGARPAHARIARQEAPTPPGRAGRAAKTPPSRSGVPGVRPSAAGARGREIQAPTGGHLGLTANANGQRCDYCGEPISGRRLRWCSNACKDIARSERMTRGEELRWRHAPRPCLSCGRPFRSTNPRQRECHFCGRLPRLTICRGCGGPFFQDWTSRRRRRSDDCADCRRGRRRDAIAGALLAARRDLAEPAVIAMVSIPCAGCGRENRSPAVRPLAFCSPNHFWRVRRNARKLGLNFHEIARAIAAGDDNAREVLNGWLALRAARKAVITAREETHHVG